jgi:hypothetical protein
MSEINLELTGAIQFLTDCCVDMGRKVKRKPIPKKRRRSHLLIAIGGMVHHIAIFGKDGMKLTENEYGLVVVWLALQPTKTLDEIWHGRWKGEASFTED